MQTFLKQVDAFHHKTDKFNMATRIRLARAGKKRKPIYNIVVADTRSPRDGRYIEKLGSFNPNVEPPIISLNEQSAFEWVMKGAQPSDTARTLLSKKGVLLRKHLQVGVLKGAIKQEDADKKYDAWKADYDQKEQSRLSDAEKAVEAKAKKDAEERLQIKADAEAKQQAAQAAALLEAEEAQKAADAEAAPAEEAPAATEEVAVEATTEEAKVEEAPKAEAPKEEVKAEAKEEAPVEAKVETPKEEKAAAPKEEKVEEVKAEEAPKEEVKAEAPAKAEAKEEKAAE